MAANRPSRTARDPQKMLMGLDNITRHTRNFIQTDPDPEPIEIPPKEEAISSEEEKKPEIKEELQHIAQVAEVIEQVKKKPGRKKKYANTAEMIRLNISFPEENYLFIKKNGWEYGGMNGFVNHLIEEEMKRREE